jgi:hypothetical protein
MLSCSREVRERVRNKKKEVKLSSESGCLMLHADGSPTGHQQKIKKYGQTVPCRNVRAGLGGRGPQKLPKEEISGQDLQSVCAFGEYGITSSVDEEKEIKMTVNSGRAPSIQYRQVVSLLRDEFAGKWLAGLRRMERGESIVKNFRRKSQGERLTLIS